MYRDRIQDFIERDSAFILGQLLTHSSGDVEVLQRNAWQQQIDLIRSIFREGSQDWLSGSIYFEYNIPRLGRRIDVVLIIGHIVFVLEFKNGETKFNADSLDQVWDYALDLKNFHEASHDVCIAPVLIPTEANDQLIDLQITVHDDKLLRPVRSNARQLPKVIEGVLLFFDAPSVDVRAWERGRYLPTPTIVEAARALYAGHAVEDISRNDAGALNLARTSKAVDRIVESTRERKRKAICFVTGVPGAGKTLVGLDVANRHLDKDSETYSVFLSGNGPLVAVLREALTRDKVVQERASGRKITKSEARKGIEAFIQNVHHFRDEYLADSQSPPEHVVLFDEAQRAWDMEKTSDFMRRKKGMAEFNQSEPEFLISCMDRHTDWAVVVCLVGGGQEINTGEAGISAWFEAILRSFKNWDIHLSPELVGAEYRSSSTLGEMLNRPTTHKNSDLHLSTSMRSFRAENLSQFVRETLELDRHAATRTLNDLKSRYPIVLTRRLDLAKQWLRDQARGSERYGIVVSSGAERLKPHAIDVRVKTDPVKWFLDGKHDTRSSYYLEDVATEFQVQGLELDWACVVWDGDLRCDGEKWAHHEFRGTRWNRVKKMERQRYLENAYRVLLTRARQGMVLVVPEGDGSDPTRNPNFYDPTYSYLQSLGLRSLS